MADDLEMELQKTIVGEGICKNYDYYYLRAMHVINKKSKPEIVIAGSSHAMNGVVEAGMTYPTINFSISSQDLFYDIINLKKAIQDNNNVKVCIINVGYYMLYEDVSKGKNVSVLVDRVYSPLFGERHNLPSSRQVSEYCRDDAELERERWTEKIFGTYQTYYGPLVSRENNNGILRNGEKWEELTDETKDKLAQRRCEEHNRLKKHIDTKIENEKLISEFAREMEERNITLIMAVFPFTKWYHRHIDGEYKMSILNCLNSITNKIYFLDMNDYSDLFEEKDFLNADHLSISGAAKATLLLNQYLEILKEEGEIMI